MARIDFAPVAFFGVHETRLVACMILILLSPFVSLAVQLVEFAYPPSRPLP